MLPELSNEWGTLLHEESKKPYYLRLLEKLNEEYAEGNVYPGNRDVFNALKWTPYDEVKVVILGQDPYHGEGQAHGLSFSVLPGVKLPPSLKNIYKELQDDLGCPPPNHGYLRRWADLGVLLLNSVLTVREASPNSHRKLGWETFTSSVIEALNAREKPMAFILWGKHAQDKGKNIDRTRHLVIESVHPSPLSAYAGFFGSRPFSQANEFLVRNGIEPIDWELPRTAEAPTSE